MTIVYCGATGFLFLATQLQNLIVAEGVVRSTTEKPSRRIFTENFPAHVQYMFSMTADGEWKAELRCLGDVEKARRLRMEAGNGNLDRVRELIKAGADVNHAESGGYTALLCASIAGHNACIPVLLDAGAELEQAEVAGWTALVLACWYGRDEITLMLLNAGANPHMVTTGARRRRSLRLRRRRPSTTLRSTASAAAAATSCCSSRGCRSPGRPPTAPSSPSAAAGAPPHWAFGCCATARGSPSAAGGCRRATPRTTARSCATSGSRSCRPSLASWSRQCPASSQAERCRRE